MSVVIEGHFTPFWCIGIGKSRIKDVLSYLSQAVSEKRASELRQSMVASQDILFWTPRGQLLWNKRIIPVTNIADLVEYVLLLPHNNDVAKPRALSTFLDELAELGFDKGLIKNKKLLSDLIEKEKGYRNAEDTSDNESHNDESSSDIENQEEQVEEEEEEEVPSVNGSEAEGIHRERKRQWNLTTVRKQKEVALKSPPPFTLEIPVNIVFC